ncbi:MAG: hypothetical protein ABW067_11940, partial [Rhizobacter sp.]
MIKRKLLALAVTALFVAPTVSVAQFKLPSLPGTGGASTSDAAAQQDQLVNAYVGADKEVLTAQAKMADAVGLKDRASQLQATSDALGAGATKESLEQSETMQSEASQEIQAKLKDGNTKLDAAGKKKFSEGLGSLGKGILKYANLKGPIANFQSAVSGGGVAGALGAASKLNAGRYIVTSTPGHVKNLSNTLSNAVNYAKSNDIPVPADATAAL